ncbi:MAG: hypothetical protein DME27_06435 [Verrucomicrobia bacterium]|nr:MAG: hypothetical protein DME27_06435 [Verrucomicrobiota bacterium]
MENAAVVEIYGKHDGGLRFSSQIRGQVLSKRNFKRRDPEEPCARRSDELNREIDDFLIND